MTGFGQAHRDTDRYTATAELRSLNSKTLDLTLRLPRFLQAHELEIRQQITKALLRGKVNFNFEFNRPASATSAPALNHAAPLARQHNTQRQEALQALVMLGFARAAAEKNLDQIQQKHGQDLSVEELIKFALKSH